MNMDKRSQERSGYKIANINTVLDSNDYYVGHEYLETWPLNHCKNVLYTLKTC